MKKISILLLLLTISFMSYAKTNVVIYTPQCENIRYSEVQFLTGQVRDKLQSNLNTCASKEYDFVNITDEELVKELQRKSEGVAYDQSMAIELGKYTTASKAFFITIRKSDTGNKGYTITLRLTNLNTGTDDVTITSTARYMENLYEGSGCAIDDITYQFCKHMKIKLSREDKERLLSNNRPHNKPDHKPVSVTTTTTSTSTSTRTYSYNYKSDKAMNCMRLGFGLGTENFCFDIDSRAACSDYSFIYLNAGSTPKLECLDKIAAGWGLFDLSAGFGLNCKILCFNLYGLSGMGLTAAYLDHGYVEKSSSDDKFTKTATYLLWHSAAGLDIKVSSSLAFYSQYVWDYSFEAGLGQYLLCGASYYF